MTARETTLGALAAADLGKRVVAGRDVDGPLFSIAHHIDKRLIRIEVGDSERPFSEWLHTHPSDTTVTVYEEEET